MTGCSPHDLTSPPAAADMSLPSDCSPKALLRRFDIEQPVVYAEIDWKALFRMAVKRVTFTDMPRTQHVERDLALLVDKSE